jgi:hypothetical protein
VDCEAQQMTKPIEYEFTKQDDSKVYEIVYERSDIWAFQRMHNAKACQPVQPAQRVQIPAYTDFWMMGDRFGEVVKVTRSRAANAGVRAALLTSADKHKGVEIAHVKLDRSGRIVRVILADCEVM